YILSILSHHSDFMVTAAVACACGDDTSVDSLRVSFSVIDHQSLIKNLYKRCVAGLNYYSCTE
ncbi:MAG: hypothetical protein WBG61_12330, partial [Desulfobacterales bacterium]